MVILLDNALGERQSQSPAPFLCREARAEDIGDILFPYAFARVCHINGLPSHACADADGYASLSLHGVDGVLAEVLDDPLEQLPVYHRCRLLVVDACLNDDFV